MLIVGSDGMIGNALFVEASVRQLNPIGTTRRKDVTRYFLDIEHQETGELPKAKVAYILAGIVGYKNCEGNPHAYRVNVDGTIKIIKRLMAQGTFIVFMSSDAVEHMLTTSYRLQKSLVEMFMQMSVGGAIVRSGRMERHMLPDLCDLLLDIGQKRMNGIFNFIPKGAQ